MGMFNFLRSTIISKVVMAVTGLVLLLFLVGHMAGNMQVFLGRETYNHYAQMLQSLGEFLWIIRGVLVLSLILHIITSVSLSARNMAAKPVKYKVKKYVNAKINSRSMLITGIMIFAFVTYHLLHLTAGITNPEHYNHKEYYESNSFVSSSAASVKDVDASESLQQELKPVVLERHDVYKMLVLGFREPAIAIAYIVFVVLLGFHLSHAIQSCFQTLGVTGPKFTPAMVKASRIFAVIIVLMYISIPISVLLGLVGGSI